VHHGAAGSECRADLAGGLKERKVPRGHGSDDTDSLVQDRRMTDLRLKRHLRQDADHSLQFGQRALDLHRTAEADGGADL